MFYSPKAKPVILRVGVGLLTSMTLALFTPYIASAKPLGDNTDTSSAVRYDTSGARKVYGKIGYDIFDTDDDGEKFLLPFPINFFGAMRTHACVTTNGGIFPTDSSSSCDDEYDEGLGDLALSAGDPFMAVLALDLDFEEGLLLLPDGTANNRDVADLTVYFNGTTKMGNLASEIVTITSPSHGLIAGDYVTFAGTNTVLDGQNYLATIIDNDQFSIAVPGVTDLDPGSNLTVVSTGAWTYSNGVGTRGIYVGNTTIDGRPAFVVTWYRTPHNDDDNPGDRSSTLQLVLIKKDAGNDTIGWDFDVEYNIGTMTDDEDGYDINDPTGECTAWENYPPVDPTDDQRDTCRWAMGFAAYYADVEIASYSASAGVVTITTSSPHTVPDNGVGVRLELPSDGCLGGLSGEIVWAKVSGPSTFTVEAPSEGDGPNVCATALPVMNLANVYEFFGDSSIATLIDSAGSTALVNNALNSTVLGRYAFSMVNGVIVGFKPPTMDGTPEFFGETPNGGGSDFDDYRLPGTEGGAEVTSLPDTGGSSSLPGALAALLVAAGLLLQLLHRRTRLQPKR